jgi:hypothetical protein
MTTATGMLGTVGATAPFVGLFCHGSGQVFDLLANELCLSSQDKPKWRFDAWVLSYLGTTLRRGKMLTDFEQNLEHWEEWQYPYRFGVILVLPPEPVRSQVNALRARYDPLSHSYCDAHISLTVPFPAELDDLHWEELKFITSTIRPFSIHYGR